MKIRQMQYYNAKGRKQVLEKLIVSFLLNEVTIFVSSLLANVCKSIQLSEYR